jgi:cephalosporin-C deacetylase
MISSEFDAYWQVVLNELAVTPPAPEEEHLPLRSGARHRTYGVKLTSIGPYRIFAYLSIPEGEGPFPAIYLFPRYMSVVEPLTQGLAAPKREQCVVFALAARGHRNADRPYAAEFPGMLTDGVEDPATYVFRGVVADCVRGLEYLAARPEVDAERIAAVGLNDLPLLAAGLLPSVRCISAHVGMFYRARELAERTSEYPHEEINDYRRTYPDRAERMFHTLDLFDPLHFAPRLRMAVQIWAASECAPWGSDELTALAENLGGPVDVEQGTGSTYKDGLVRERWVSEQLQVEPVLPKIWQRTQAG